MNETSPTAAVLRPVRAAATLIVLRDGPSGLQVLLLRRAEKEADQNSGAAVFPGGTIDTHDRTLHDRAAGIDDAWASRRLNLPSHGLDYYVAAVRECFEEAGLLFAADADDRLVVLDALPADTLAQLRHAAQEGTDALLAVCSERGWRLAVDRLAYLTHWLTPLGMPRRFDTRFFVALAPAGQQASPDGRETVEHLWLRPAEALEPARGLKLMNVTERVLEDLTRFETAAECLAQTRALQEIPLIFPRLASALDKRRVVNPGDPAYDEVGYLDPEGKGNASCDLVPGLATRLSARVGRVVARADAAAPLGTSGFNSYLVGGDRNEWAVIDAGPDDEAHLAALLAAAPGPVRWILSTRASRMRSPAAVRLVERTGAAIGSLAPGDRLDLGAAFLRAVRAPGANGEVLQFLLEEDRMLFDGGHPMAGELSAGQVDWLAPAHGFLQRLRR